MLLQDGATADEKYFSKNFQFLSLGAMAYIGEHVKAADLQSGQYVLRVICPDTFHGINIAYTMRCCS